MNIISLGTIWLILIQASAEEILRLSIMSISSLPFSKSETTTLHTAPPPPQPGGAPPPPGVNAPPPPPPPGGNGPLGPPPPPSGTNPFGLPPTPPPSKGSAPPGLYLTIENIY